ncbi:MAG: hypothetical protein JXA13_07250 [Anaerolineales bacterium]|nr:hypothetical protein [Anaerolineales bacterium]
MKRLIFSLQLLTLLAIGLSSCSPQPAAPTIDPDLIMTQAFGTVSAQSTQTALASQLLTPASTETPIPTATIPRTPPALPGLYTTGLLNPKDTPHPYIQDTCQYLKDKWGPNKAVPGTVVMVIMIHGVTKGDANTANAISSVDYKKLMKNLKEQGFEAINTQQMADFMESNAYIPPRSVLLTQDDRHFVDNFNDHFRPYWNEWGWPLVSGWISYEDSIRQQILADNIALSNEGWVDYQSHGYFHNTPMSDSSPEDYIRGEFEGSMTDLQQNFGKTPIAIIWPGGGFGSIPVRIGREYGYRLGFTVNPRGPVMYNWVPLSDESDPMRPSYLSEGYVGDPLMTLPRYWDTNASSHIDTVRTIGNEAAIYAEQYKAVELDYYDIVCTPSYGPISAP